MPQVFVVYAAIASVAGVTAGVIVAAAYVVVYAAVLYGFSQLARAFQKNPNSGAGGISALDTSRTLVVREPAATRKLLYGQARLGGVMVFASTSGTDNEYLHIIVAHVSHECEEIGDVFLNEEIVPLDGSGNATGKYAGYFTVKKHLGTSGQTVDTDLQTAVGSGVWSNNHRLRGTCYSYLKFKHSPDLFPNGLPNYSALIKGKKVYDPRTTGTSWSDNVALCTRDYLMDTVFGLIATAGEMDDAAVIAAANICDEAVLLADGVTYEKRYTLNGPVDTNTQCGAVVAEMLDAMAGICPYIDGQFKMKAGAHTASVQPLTLDDARAGISLSTGDALRDSFNAVKGVYISDINNWQPGDFPPVVNSLYLSEDQGERKWKDISLPFTNSPGMAQRLAKIELERSRQDFGFIFPGKLNLLNIQAGDVVALTVPRYGFTAKLFEVQETSFAVSDQNGAPSLGIDLTLRETASGVWDWNNGEETEVDLAPNTDLVDFYGVSAPTGLVLSAEWFEQTDGTVAPRLHVEWTQPTNVLIKHGGYAHIEYKKSADSDWLVWTASLRGDAVQDFITDVQTGIAYDVRMRFENVRGVRSAYCATVSTTMDAVNLLTDLSNLVYNPNFAQGDAGWIINAGEFVINSTNGENGSGAAQVLGPAIHALRNKYDVFVRSGDRFHLRAHVVGINMYARVTCYDKTDTEIYYSETPRAGSNSVWKTVDKLVVPPDNTVWVRAEVVGDTTSCKVDYLYMGKIPPGVTYTDPSTQVPQPTWFYSGGNVTLACMDGSATIKYTKNGGALTTYSAPFAASPGDLIQTYATRASYADSTTARIDVV